MCPGVHKEPVVPTTDVCTLEVALRAATSALLLLCCCLLLVVLQWLLPWIDGVVTIIGLKQANRIIVYCRTFFYEKLQNVSCEYDRLNG